MNASCTDGHWFWLPLIYMSTQCITGILSRSHIGNNTGQYVSLEPCATVVVQGQRLFCHRAECCHKDETNTSRGHLISISCSSQIFNKNSHIRDGALRDIQGCSKSAYIFFLFWHHWFDNAINRTNFDGFKWDHLYSVGKLLILSLTHSNQPELKTSHGNSLGFLRDRNDVLRNGFETKIENVFDKIQRISYLTC